MAKDLFHQAVKQALIKDDPLIIRIDRVKLEINLAAEKVLAAEKDGQKIAVEVKSFINPSAITDFHNALGQFLNYRLALEMTEPKHILYLAVPIDIFNTFFQERFTQASIAQYSLKTIAYEPNIESQIIFDLEHDHYQVLDVGWQDLKRVHDCFIHLDIKDGKIWIQHNMTEADLGEELVERGVPASDIILGLHPPLY